MPFDWRELLVVAHALRDETGEGAQRTSLGRAYYYIFNLGLLQARAMSFTGQIPGLHRKLWGWYQKHSSSTIRHMGIDAARMYSLRISSDYSGASIPSLAREVKIQLARAQKFERSAAQIGGKAPPMPLAR